MEQLNFSIGTNLPSPAGETRRSCIHRSDQRECRRCHLRRIHEGKMLRGECGCLPRIPEEGSENSSGVNNLRLMSSQQASCIRKVIRSQLVDSFRHINRIMDEAYEIEDPHERRRRLFAPHRAMARVSMIMRREQARYDRRQMTTGQEDDLSLHMQSLSVSPSGIRPSDLSAQFNRLTVNNTPVAGSSTSTSSRSSSSTNDPLNTLLISEILPPVTARSSAEGRQSPARTPPPARSMASRLSTIRELRRRLNASERATRPNSARAASPESSDILLSPSQGHLSFPTLSDYLTSTSSNGVYVNHSCFH